MRLRLLLTTALAMSPLMVVVASPSYAEVTNVGIELANLQTEIAQLEGRANDFGVADVYECPPPNPIQIELEALGRLGAKHAELKNRFDAARKEANAKVHRGAGGNLAAGDIPDYGRVKFDTSSQSMQTSYWRAYNNALDRIAKTIKAKEDALRRARVIPCPGTTPKTEIIVQPPLPPNPPPVKDQPPVPPKERSWDPLAGLTKPTFAAADIPVAPQFFCSQAEKDAMLNRISPAQAKLQSEADAYEAYAKTVESRKAQLTAQGLPDHWQRSLDYEASEARKMRDDRLTTMKSLETIRRYIEGIPVVDCTTKPKDGLKTGWDFKGGVDYGLGRLTFPDAGYLGVENPISTDRINGIIRSAGEDSGFRRIGAHVELPLDMNLPNIFAPIEGQLSETRLRGLISRTSASSVRWGTFDPMGDTLFVPGLTDNIANTFTLPSTFDATVRDNLVDDFWADTRYRRSEFGLSLVEDFTFRGCDAFTLTKNFGLLQSWTDRHDSFRAEVRDYFPIASPGFDVTAKYNTTLESSTTALSLGLDGIYAPKSWNRFFVKAGLNGWVGYSDTDGTAALRLDVNGSLSRQSAEFSKSETTFGYGVKGSIGYDIDWAKIEATVGYKNDGDSPVTELSPGELPRINFENAEETYADLGINFSF